VSPHRLPRQLGPPRQQRTSRASRGLTRTDAPWSLRPPRAVSQCAPHRTPPRRLSAERALPRAIRAPVLSPGFRAKRPLPIKGTVRTSPHMHAPHHASFPARTPPPHSIVAPAAELTPRHLTAVVRACLAPLCAPPQLLEPSIGQLRLALAEIATRCGRRCVPSSLLTGASPTSMSDINQTRVSRITPLCLVCPDRPAIAAGEPPLHRQGHACETFHPQGHMCDMQGHFCEAKKVSRGLLVK
jgi:hypothetical protein